MVLFIAYNCDNEPYEGDLIIVDNSCELAIIATAEAASNFNAVSEENFNLFCQVYKDALEDQIEICGDAEGLLQLTIDSLNDCVFEGNELCDMAIQNTEIARINYDNASDSDLEALCNSYKVALQNQIEVCGDADGLLQIIITGLGDCTADPIPTIGTWQLVFMLSNNILDIDNDGIATTNYLGEIDCYDNEIITFNADGTGEFIYNSFATITYTPISDDDVDFFVTCTDFNENTPFTWTQNDNEITITLTETGEVLDFLKSTSIITNIVEDGFFATSTVNSSTISEDMTFTYLKI
tara:strand:+ start:13681 stop:14568 length:888 start_codon:yes stop_codon:yes gene_type:complete